MGVLVLLISFFSGGRLIAQAVRAALVQNVDEPGRHPYAETASCLTGNCVLTFSVVPSGERLVVTSVSAESFALSGRLLQLGGHGPVIHYLPITSFFNNIASLSLPTTAYFDAGESPQLLCDDCNPNPTNLKATLSGYVINLP
ncbi:MAG TPA: hypothetical protein VFW44_07125 [Bryobacteraceae bacterium]|nr:hypothetical protein [Bryobacteraceae bacterium]